MTSAAPRQPHEFRERHALQPAGRHGRQHRRQRATRRGIAGAPGRKNAGVLLHANAGDRVEKGAPLYEIHAETPGELEWARDYANSRAHPFAIEDAS